MLKFLPLVKAPVGMTTEESAYHYRWHHSSVVTQAIEFNRYMPKYVQNHPLTRGSVRRVVGEPSTAASRRTILQRGGFQRAFEDPAYAPLREDEVRFANFDELVLVAANAVPVFGPARDASFKVWRFANFCDVDARRARLFWEMTYASAVSRDERLRRVLVSYVQNRKIDNFTSTFPDSVSADIVDEFWIQSLDVLPELLEAEQELRDRIGHESWIDPVSTIMFVAESKLLWDFGENPSAAWSRLRRWDEKSTHPVEPLAALPVGS
ncbi:hypothetical protein BJF90_15680 [Pseudonocardia sp. CNS-004]|nr:hypothetical protein BJF90_15680 [Pseudonocardia sp. CNS-004]